MLESARAGDEDAFAALVQPLRGELHARCRQMLTSSHDADDALQETLLRLARPARLRGSQLTQVLASPHRHQRLPQHDHRQTP